MAEKSRRAFLKEGVAALAAATFVPKVVYAKGQTERIWEAIKYLEMFPSSHQDRLEGRYAGQGYKQLLIDNYIAVFKIDEKSKTVYVVTVQYHGQNF